MSVDGWKTLLVLGGIRSGKSEFAESLVRDAPQVRYLATAASHPDDPEWGARIQRHRERRPSSWTTEEIGGDPARLAQAIAAAHPAETLLVDDLGGWVSALLAPDQRLEPGQRPDLTSADGSASAATDEPAGTTADGSASAATDGSVHIAADAYADSIAELAAAIRDCAARLVLVSSEVGLAMVPLTQLGRAFADTLGATNQAVAAACDAVVLVVAGQPAWLKSASSDDRRAITPVTVASNPGEQTTAEPEFKVGMNLPMPDEDAGSAALERLGTLDFAGAGLGHLERVVRFAAATQSDPVPVPWRSARVLLLHGDHAGGAAAGTSLASAARRAEEARRGVGPLALLAAQAGATLEVVSAPPAAPIEDGPALSAEAVESALRLGWRLVARAAADGVQVLVLAACGAGAETAAATVLATTAGAEPAAVLGRVVRPDGHIDDAAWMTRCATARDALHRSRHSQRDAKGILAELAGGDIAVATGILLSAAAHRLPVLLDGPVGVAAGLVSRELGGQARHWCLLPDHGGHPGVRLGADILDLEPLFDLRLDLGEGTRALSALPLLRSALTLAATTSNPPVTGQAEPGEQAAEPDQEPTEPGQELTESDEEFAEPAPAGPGPTRTTTGAGA